MRFPLTQKQALILVKLINKEKLFKCDMAPHGYGRSDSGRSHQDAKGRAHNHTSWKDAICQVGPKRRPRRRKINLGVQNESRNSRKT